MGNCLPHGTQGAHTFFRLVGLALLTPRVPNCPLLATVSARHILVPSVVSILLVSITFSYRSDEAMSAWTGQKLECELFDSILLKSNFGSTY